jgi:hypothetical protein
MSEPFDPYLKWLGIREADRPPNNYRLLGIRLFEGDPEVISNAADRQMAHVRTFQAGRHSAVSQRLLNELAGARVCLLNAEKKQAYDLELRAREPSSNPAPRNPAPPAVVGESFSAPQFSQSITDPAPPPANFPPTAASVNVGRRVFRRRRRSNAVPVTIGLIIVLALVLGLAAVIAMQQSEAPEPYVSGSSRLAPDRPAPPKNLRDGAAANPTTRATRPATPRPRGAPVDIVSREIDPPAPSSKQESLPSPAAVDDLSVPTNDEEPKPAPDRQTRPDGDFSPAVE